MFFVANRVYVQRGKARQASSARPPGFQGGDQVLASDAKARYVENSSSKRARADDVGVEDHGVWKECKS